MTEYHVVLRKVKYANIMIEAKDEEEAGELAMGKYEEGLAELTEDEVEVMETEEM